MERTTVFILRTASAIAILIVLIGVLFLAFDWTGEKSAMSDIRAGVICDKEHVNVGGVFSPVQTHYRLHIEGTYEWNGEAKTGKTFYDVPEDVYSFYKVGDTIDITDYRSSMTSNE